MFSNQSGSGGSRAGAAKRALSSFLETSGLVCGSLKDTVQDKLADSDMNMKWVEHEIDNIKTKLEKPREQILNMTDKACIKGGKEPLSPAIPGSGSACAMGAGSFLDDNTVDGTGTLGTAEGMTASVGADDDTMVSDTPSRNKIQSRFAPVVEDARQREKAAIEAAAARVAAGGADVVIGLCLSRKNPTLGHPNTVTRQTAFDFNELQDRDYKYVSSTDDSGWLAGGGERGDPYFDQSGGGSIISSKSEDSNGMKVKSFGAGHKIAAPDRVHIPIIQINAASSAVIEEIVSALARGEIFIPEVSILPETLSVNNTSPPDLQVRFGCEKNDDTPPEEWPNWCLEFLHNQLYDYFAPVGARWSKRPFRITLARKVRWMTVKHMNKYFARSEQVIHSWREKGPQYLQPPYSDDSSRGVILEEITRPHGIYLIQNGVPTNYFAPNFQPPYTTKMRRSLIKNVINKSWDSKHRDWLSEPMPLIRGPAQLISSVMGCANPGHLSPVEDAVVASNVGAFHMRSNFDLVHDNIDMGTLTPTHEHEENRSRKNIRKNKETYHSDKQQQQQKDVQRNQSEEREKDIDTRQITSSVPSDESYGASTRPSGTISLSIDETISETVNDTITANRTNSTSVESPEQAKQWSAEFSPDKESQDDRERKPFSLNGRTSSFGSSKGVSFSDSSLTESERERSTIPRRQRQQKVDPPELPLKEPQYKVGDRGVDKFSRSKSKRREMRDRRQDENGERSTPTSKASPSPSRRSKRPEGSPSNDSMAYSLDSASQFRFPVAVNSTNDGGSVFTSATENQSLLSYVTRSTMVQSRYQEEPNLKNVRDEDEGDDISLSLLESKSSIIPNDEELNAVGWAKALDPNSGSYYYFTLDRSKTVWENPLATSP
eukprot:CAMPEP_0183716718 /NCGR_PEP_ID=MMETSP0737-20130205/10513_1 /TAXON_ID=385413 /ORGANISM="Thalassiosira miniscula, Strain CCMP1093" /LENGTH=886 /DNA_ID=CAMNT_0025946013 /DNA_START=107 /DNA_END=2767 /DNA_ORIENTATION=+